MRRISEVKNHAIKLFGKTIPLLLNEQVSVFTTPLKTTKTHVDSDEDQDDNHQQHHSTSHQNLLFSTSCSTQNQNRVGEVQEKNQAIEDPSNPSIPTLPLRYATPPSLTTLLFDLTEAVTDRAFLHPTIESSFSLRRSSLSPDSLLAAQSRRTLFYRRFVFSRLSLSDQPDSVSDPNQRLQPIDGRFIVTVFPKKPLDGAHEIQSFCLGHTKFDAILPLGQEAIMAARASKPIAIIGELSGFCLQRLAKKAKNFQGISYSKLANLLPIVGLSSWDADFYVKTKSYFAATVASWDANFYVKVDDDVHVNIGNTRRNFGKIQEKATGAYRMYEIWSCPCSEGSEVP
ncbi:unnamed protein product [Camellia sinensis]